MSFFTESQTKDGGRFFKAVGAGSGRVRFDGASDARGLLHAIADASARHRAAVLGYEGGNEHPTLDAREVGSSISSRPDLTTVEQIVLAQIRIYQDKTGRPPTADEVAALRREAETSLQDLLGDWDEAATPLQKVAPATTVEKAIADSAGEVTPEQRKRLAAAAVGAFEDREGRQPDAEERDEIQRMLDEALAEAVGSVSGWKGFGWAGAAR